MDTALSARGTAAARLDDRKARLIVFAVAGALAVAAAAAVSLTGAESRPALVALARAVIVGAPIAVGLYAWYRRIDERFGVLLALAGGAWFLTTLGESQDELVYTIGRAAGWFVEILLVYLILAFPTGRLADRTDRLLVGAIGLAVVATYLPRLVLAQHFEVPSPYTSCVRDCPANAFFLFQHEPAFVGSVLRPLGVVMVLVVATAVLVRVWRRMQDATPLAQRMITPLLWVGLARLSVLAVGISARLAGPQAASVPVVAWLLALAAPAMALAFLLGLVRWQLFAGRALQHLAVWLRAAADPVRLRWALAEALSDPGIEIVFPAPGASGRWMDCRGRPAALPGTDAGRSVTEVHQHGRLLAAVVHDRALDAHPELLDAGVAIAGVALDNQRLAVEAEAAAREVRHSRARIAAGAERERRRIERDLHDGAQQRLVALRIELQLAEDLVRLDPEKGAARLQELQSAVEEALEDLRHLAHGVYPPLLADRGLTEALESVAARSVVRVELETRHVGRYPAEVESAVYFCVLEALQNTLKHAGGARRVVVSLDGGVLGRLRFTVRDDGGGAPGGVIRPGAGITNMRDRLAAFGGDVEVTSTPNVGTTVRAGVPTAASAPARAQAGRVDKPRGTPRFPPS